MGIVSAVEKGDFSVKSVKRSTKHKSPAPPFTTSTMLQEASKKLGVQSQRIMRVAQELYEGVNLGSEYGGVQGLITYMRTDSLRISAEAQASAKEYIVEKYGEEYYPEKPREYKSKALSQDAHEAIRPARVDLEPIKIRKMLSSDQYRLYKLIWDRFVASQMQSAEMATLTVDFENSGYIFRASGYNVTFQGYMALYEEAGDEVRAQADEPGEVADIKIPDLKKGDALASRAISPDKHFTEAPPRYTERSLVKCLEDMGIGRPSTYTPIITTIVARNYVKREGGSLVPTPLGEVTTTLMEENFKDIVDYKFTADMEKKLDAIGKGTKSINSLLGDFWKDFSVELQRAEKNIGSQSIEIPAEETDIICDKCGQKMVIKNGRFGKFAACPNYPKCRNTKPLTPAEKPAKENDEGEKEQKKVQIADFKCEKCGSDMVLRSGPFGSFYACSKYPTCKFTKAKTKELGVDCPACGSKIITKYGRNKIAFYSCEKYPECNFSTWDMPTNERCPDCNSLLFKKKGKALLVCSSGDCKFSKEYVADAKKGNDNE
jgi:DNA topoisomerase-1